MKLSVCLFLAIQCAAQGPSQKLPKKSLLAKYRIVFDKSTYAYGVDIYVIDGNGDQIRQITKDHDSRTPSWSADGRQILFLRETIPTTGRQEMPHSVTQSTGVPVEVWRMDASGKKPNRITSIGPDALDVLWMPDGEHVALRVSNRRNLPVVIDQPGHLATNSGQLLPLDQFDKECEAAVAADPAWQRPELSEFFAPADNFLPVLHASWRKPDLSFNYIWEFAGKAPLVQDRSGSLRIIDLEGQPALPDSLPFDTAWSPSGDRISYSTFAGDRDADLHVTSFPKQENTDPLSIMQGLDPHGPVWSPDGSRIAFIGFWKDSSYLFVIDADGNHLTQISHDPLLSCLHPSWSPDGRWIVAECRGKSLASVVIPVPYPPYYSNIVRFDVAHPSAPPHFFTSCGSPHPTRETEDLNGITLPFPITYDNSPCGAHHPSFMPVPQTKASPAAVKRTASANPY